MRRTLALLLAGLCSAAAATAQTLPIHDSRITGTVEVKSGGELEIESGGTLDVQSGATVNFGDPLSLANGGLGVALTDPGADRLVFWDDSESTAGWLTIGTGLTISGTTLSADADVGFSNPMTTAGDIIIGGTDGAAERLAIGTSGQILTVSDGAPAWADAPTTGAPTDATYIVQTASDDLSAEQALGALSTGLLKVTTTTGVLSTAVAGTDYLAVPGSSAEGDILYRDGSGWTRLAKGTDGQVLKSTSSSVAWGTDSTGSGSLPGSPSAGDLAYYDGEDWLSLAIGTASQVLTVNSGATAPEWAAASGGSGGTATLARWTALGNQPPASAYATFDTRNAIAVLDFNDSSDESAVFVGVIPESADLSSGISVRLVWTATSATSGDVIWTSAVERSNTDLDSDSFASAVTASAATTNGTSGIATTTTIDHSDSEIDGLTAGDLFRLKITRDADNASDTMSGDAEIIAVEIRSR